MSDTHISKASILHACQIKQELTISDFEKEVKNIRQNLTDHDEIASQAHRGSGGQNEMLVRLEHELSFLKKELETLNNLDPNEAKTHVEHGAVVVTDQRTFFISTSIEQVEVNEKSIFGISVKAPIFKVMEGKKSGESFEFNGIRYQIESIY